MKKQTGFTLIELVLVIVILGILSAFALPRFADLSGDARIAVLDGGIGATKSAAAIAHSKWLAEGGSPAIISMEGASVAMSGTGYPTAAADGIVLAAQLDDFTLNGTVIELTGAPTQATCSFNYDATDGSTDTRQIAGC